MSSTAALLPRHFFISHSGPDERWAACECGYPLDWETRDEDHTLHLLAVAWNRGYNSTKVTTNPFYKEN